MRKRLTRHPLKYKSAAAGLRRQISEDFKYNPKKIKHLKHILHNVSVSLGTLISALNEFSRVKGPDISPDGMLGGFGYIIPIREMKQSMIEMVHKLSDIADSLADELTNPKWNMKEDEEVKELIKEKEKMDERIDDEITPDDVVTNPENEDSDEKPEEEETEKKEPDDEDNVIPGSKDDDIYEEPGLKFASVPDVKLASEVRKALVKYHKPKNKK